MSGFLMALIALWLVWEAVHAVRTGELRAKGGVIRRSEHPVMFYLMIGVLLCFTAAVLEMTFGFGLLLRLVNLNL